MSALRVSLAGVALLVGLGAAGCGGDPAPATQAPVAQESQGRQVPDASSSPGAAAGLTPSGAASAAPGGTTKHVFPLQGKGSYSHDHHDYPASDIIANCGLNALSPVNGTVLEVTRVDTWTAKVNEGSSRGGLSVSILGDDGARYYMSHFSSINNAIEAGVRVEAGQPVAKVGRTGDASACHIHFGLSPACQKTGDWWTRRGVIWPWSYLDAWKADQEKSPVAELNAWEQQHGCPAKATADP
ncbi:M23 family metallopeptidase [Dactylosporangium salmoneum]|uniref:M23ase beta-sheet core domain-containing protein n=1 Tax=Dactylosporangium salmoneum TaxID=53361 RepID=A0ABN3I5Z6_9ACTN